jgi:hypothetical protein
MKPITLIELSALLETFFEMSVKTAKSVPPTGELKKLYFDILKDLDFETVNRNGRDHFTRNRYFPAACDLLGNSERLNDARADRAFRLVEHLMNEFYDPAFQQACMAVIVSRVEMWEKADSSVKELNLIHLVKRWGLEIWEKSNPSATRAQFLKSFSLELGSYLSLREPARPQLSEKTEELLRPLIDKEGS